MTRGRHAAPKPPLPRPVAFRMHQADVARFAERGQHCEARRCREPAVIVTWRWWRSAAIGKILVAEHFVCLQHGQDFADRHRIEVEPPPEEESTR